MTPEQRVPNMRDMTTAPFFTSFSRFDRPSLRRRSPRRNRNREHSEFGKRLVSFRGGTGEIRRDVDPFGYNGLLASP
jgi:hypothetical protein